MDKYEYKGTTKCPVAALAHLATILDFGNLMQELTDEGAFGDRAHEAFEKFVAYSEALSQGSYDKGFDDGQEHMAGKSDASRKERKQALDRRRDKNGAPIGVPVPLEEAA